jgi:hypothetical protein
MGNLEKGGGDLSPRTARDTEWRVLGTERLFLWGSEKGTWRGASFLGTLNICKEGCGDGASFSM